MSDRPRVAVFRPNDERIESAIETLESIGATAVPDPMLEIEPTDAVPESGAKFVILTSKTGVELVSAAGWEPTTETLCCIGPKTAAACEAAGWAVDLVPDTYTSRGLVSLLVDRVSGQTVEVARSDHGSPVLTDGLSDAGALVHETILYRLTRPASAGRSVELAATNELDGAAFTSSLTVEHFIEAAVERGIKDEALAGLDHAVVGAIGPPTAETAAALDIDVDIVPTEATFDRLATAVVDRINERNI